MVSDACQSPTIPVFLFQSFQALIVYKQLHLLDGNTVQLLKPLLLTHAFLYEQGVQIFKIGKTDELGHIGLIANIALDAGACVPPGFRGLAKECHIQHIGFGGVD